MTSYAIWQRGKYVQYRSINIARTIDVRIGISYDTEMRVGVLENGRVSLTSGLTALRGWITGWAAGTIYHVEDQPIKINVAVKVGGPIHRRSH